MKAVAGITGITFGIFSLLRLAIWGSILGYAESKFGGGVSWLGAHAPVTNQAVQDWGNSVQVQGSIIMLLSWLASLLAISGGAFCFSQPIVGGVLLGLSAYAHWHLLGTGAIGNIFTLPIAASACLALFAGWSKATREASSEFAETPAQRVSGRAEPNLASSPAGLAPSPDRAKWVALLKYDEDLSAAADRLRPFGEKWIDELASSFLAIDDKAYLPGIVEKLSVQARAEAEEKKRVAEAYAEEQRNAAAREEEERLEAFRIERERRAWLHHFFWGTAFRKAGTVAAILIVAVGSGAAIWWLYPWPLRAVPVWTPSDEQANAAQQCRNVECVVELMRRSGASPATISLTRRLSASIGSIDWPLQIYPFPVADLIVFNCRFCRTGGFALVDHAGQLILANANPLEPELSRTMEVQFGSSHPRVLLTSYGNRFLERTSTERGVRYVFLSAVAECNACTPFATVKYGFDFSREGQFLGPVMLGFAAPGYADGPASISPPAN